MVNCLKEREDMKKELKLGEPILKCYQKGRFMTMMLSQNKNTLPWIFYNNMQICCHKLNERGEPFVIDLCNAVAPFITKEWDACPYIHDNSFSIERIKEKYNCVVDYLIDCINHKEYVHFCLNTSYVKAYNYPTNKMHDIFISGYDTDISVFVAYDFYSGNYERRLVPFAEIEQAILHIDECDDIGDYANGIHSFSLQDCYQFSYYGADDINVYNIVQKMFEILNPSYSEPRNMIIVRKEGNKINSFGLKVYDEYIGYLKSGVVKDNESKFDYRPFYVIKDHLQIINSSIEFFNMPFKKEIEELLKISINLATVALKMSVTRREIDKEYLCDILQQIKGKEEMLLNNIIKYYK